MVGPISMRQSAHYVLHDRALVLHFGHWGCWQIPIVRPWLQSPNGFTVLRFEPCPPACEPPELIFAHILRFEQIVELVAHIDVVNASEQAPTEISARKLPVRSVGSILVW